MYKEYAKIYDLIYSDKDYKKEARKVINLVKKYKKSDGKELLEVACGTGKHLEYFRKNFHVTGLDINAQMLKIAKKRLHNISLIRGDMINFNLNKKFDVILCLFSSIGYVKTYENLEKTIRNFSKHLKKNGIVIIDPWFTKSSYKVGFPHLKIYSDDKIKIARAAISKRIDNISILDFHFLVAEKNKEVKHFVDRHELGLFEDSKVLQIMEQSGLKTKFLKKGLRKGRPLFIGLKQKS